MTVAVTASACGGQVGGKGGPTGDLFDGSPGSEQHGVPVTIASTSSDITALAFDGTDLYWTQGFGGWAMGNPYPMDGMVLRATSAGGDVVTLATSQRYPGTITLGAGEVYWANGMFGTADGWIMRVAAEGGTPSTCASAQEPIAMAVDGENVYWSVVGAVLRRPIVGGPVVTLASDGQVRGHLALLGGALYWGTTDGVTRIPTDGGAAVAVASGQATGLMAHDSAEVYWIGGAPPSLVRTAVDGGTSAPIASVSSTVGGLVTDGISVYWTDTAGGTVLKVGVSGGAVMTLATGQSAPTALAMDSQSLYWVSGASEARDIVKLTPR